MHGVRRVVIFCLLTTFLPILLLVVPLYLRHNLYADVVYAVTESDIMEITDGVSTIFCSAHTLQMNGTFNAFQMAHRPEITSYRKHIRLKKSMTLPDDTLEYWGFYLLRGATVALSVCSRFPGASILVVKGERTLRTCGMLDHNRNKARNDGIFLPEAHNHVKITFETNAQLIDSSETPRPELNLTITPNELQDDPHAHKPSQIKPETISRLSSSVQSYINKLLMENSEKNHRNRSASVETKLRHARKRWRQQNVQENERNNRIDETEISQKFRRKREILNENVRNIEKNPAKFRQIYESFQRIQKKSLLDVIDLSTENHFFARKSDYDAQHTKTLSPKFHRRLQSLKTELETPGIDTGAEENEFGEKFIQSHNYHKISRNKRNQEPKKPPALLDRGIKHGGNAFNAVNPVDEESSVSSFEEGLFNCYEGQVLLAEEFPPSATCRDVHSFSGSHVQAHHNVTEDGYYYYIFYSDNDVVFNDIHAVFDIWKPTFQYENVTKSCVNESECTFPLNLMSNDRVIVEIPTRDGIEHEADDISLLVSVCHPRMGMYVIFPISVLFLIISCAFL